MRSGISADGPSLDTKVGERFGTSKYLLIVDLKTGKVEAVVNPGASSLSHSGIQAVIMVISKKPDVLLTGYVSPTAEKHLTANRIRVVRGKDGSVSEALEQFKQSLIEENGGRGNAPTRPAGAHGDSLIQAIKSSAKQFGSALPVMLTVILLLGLFQAFVGKDVIASFFSGQGLEDTFKGAVAGSLFPGNPITSYIIGGEILAVKPFLLPVMISYFGWTYVLLLTFFMFITSVAFGYVLDALCKATIRK